LLDFPALHFRDATENDLCVWSIYLQFKHASSGDLRASVANGDQAKQCRAASQTPGTFNDIFKEESEGASIEWCSALALGRLEPFTAIIRYYTDVGELLVVSRTGHSDGTGGPPCSLRSCMAFSDVHAGAIKTADQLARAFYSYPEPQQTGHRNKS
jgi:hypothetical protein